MRSPMPCFMNLRDRTVQYSFASEQKTSHSKACFANMKRCSTQIGRRLRTAIVFPLVAESALWGAIGLEQLGIGVPLLRQGLGVIFLSFVPGLVIVNILGTRGLSLVEVLLYSVGFSLASVLLVSFAANEALPFLGVANPISFWPLTL